MLLREVGYARPGSVEEAVRVLAGNDGARALAGGQTLINVMKARVASPDVLVDLSGLGDLRGIERTDDGGLRIGAMTTLAEVITSSEVAASRPILAEVASRIADVQVRNRGTVGGNLCSNDPTNHLPPLMVALGASMTIVGAAGERSVPAEEFFLGVYLTAVGQGELLSAVTVPAGRSDGWASVTVGADGTGIVNVAASLEEGTRVAIGCVDAVPVLVRPSDAGEASVREAVRAASLGPPSDVHGSAEYRRHLAQTLAVRAVQEAAAR